VVLKVYQPDVLFFAERTIEEFFEKINDQ